MTMHVVQVVSLLLGSSLSLYAQVELPDLDIYNYLPPNATRLSPLKLQRPSWTKEWRFQEWRAQS